MSLDPSDFRTALDMDMSAKGLNERTLGERMGVSQQSISKWRKRNFPPLYRLEQLREILGADSYVARMDFGQMVRDMPRTRLVPPTNVDMPMFSNRAEPAPLDAKIGGAHFTYTKPTVEAAALMDSVKRAEHQTQRTEDFRAWVRKQEDALRDTLPARLRKHIDTDPLRVGPKEVKFNFDYASPDLILEVKFVRDTTFHVAMNTGPNACLQLAAARTWLGRDGETPPKAVLALVGPFEEYEDRYGVSILHGSRLEIGQRMLTRMRDTAELLDVAVVSFGDTGELVRYIAEFENEDVSFLDEVLLDGVMPDDAEH